MKISSGAINYWVIMYWNWIQENKTSYLAQDEDLVLEEISDKDRSAVCPSEGINTCKYFFICCRSTAILYPCQESDPLLLSLILNPCTLFPATDGTAPCIYPHGHKKINDAKFPFRGANTKLYMSHWRQWTPFADSVLLVEMLKSAHSVKRVQILCMQSKAEVANKQPSWISWYWISLSLFIYLFI